MLIKQRYSKQVCASRRAQLGGSIIESMVALVVLSIGVLGMIGVQLRTLVDSQNSVQIMTATRMADDLFERVKSNPNADVAFNTAYDPANPLNTAQWTWLNSYQVAWGATIAQTADCAAVFCTAAQRAAWDVNQWKLALTGRMIGGNAQILRSPDNPRQLIAIIGWPAKESAAGTAMVTTIPNVTVPTACGTTHSCYFAYGQP
jgi:type IV pilus assembly protein PilV